MMNYKNPLTLYQGKIFLTTKCSLRCTHCLNSKIKIPKEVASVEFAKQQIDFLVAMGIENIELGVLVGDSFEYPVDNFSKIIAYLESNSSVKRISVSSPLLFLKAEHISIINRTNKFYIQLSWYGKDDEEYRKIGGFKKGFSRLLKNIELLKGVKTKVNLTVISMFPEKTHSNELISKLADITSTTNINVLYDRDAEITDWTKMLSDKESYFERDRKGACDYLFVDFGIDERGDVLACSWFDYSRLVVLGNINENTPEEIMQEHKKIVKQQEYGIFVGPCKNCTVYSCTGTNQYDKF